MSGGSKSKLKGNLGERELGKMLGTIFGGNFARVPNSGSMTGGKNAFRKQILSDTQNRIYRGDLIPPDHMPKMVLECKNYKDFRFHQLMTPEPCKQLDEWFKQTIDCIIEGDVWFVSFKITRIGWFIAVPYNDEYVFGNHCIYSGEHGKFQITDLTEFFQQNCDLILRKCA